MFLKRCVCLYCRPGVTTDNLTREFIEYGEKRKANHVICRYPG